MFHVRDHVRINWTRKKRHGQFGTVVSVHGEAIGIEIAHDAKKMTAPKCRLQVVCKQTFNSRPRPIAWVGEDAIFDGSAVRIQWEGKNSHGRCFRVAQGAQRDDDKVALAGNKLAPAENLVVVSLEDLHVDEKLRAGNEVCAICQEAMTLGTINAEDVYGCCGLMMCEKCTVKMREHSGDSNPCPLCMDRKSMQRVEEQPTLPPFMLEALSRFRVVGPGQVHEKDAFGPGMDILHADIGGCNVNMCGAGGVSMEEMQQLASALQNHRP